MAASIRAPMSVGRLMKPPMPPRPTRPLLMSAVQRAMMLNQLYQDAPLGMPRGASRPLSRALASRRMPSI